MFYFHTLAPRRMVFRAGVFVVAPQRMPTISPIGICPNLLNRRAMSVPRLLFEGKLLFTYVFYPWLKFIDHILYLFVARVASIKCFELIQTGFVC